MSFEPPPDQTPPLLFGPRDVVEGYYDLEVHERNQAFQTLSSYSDAVALWYRALTLHLRAMLGGWELVDPEPGSAELMAQGLQMQLLGLSVCASKAALDMLLAGYYSVAFGVIRHMLESFVQCIYVSLEPEQAALWYEQEGGIEAQRDPPGMRAMRQAINANSLVGGTNLPGLINEVYNAWRLMCKGSHPSGVGIQQTVDDDSERYVIGATYRRDLCLAGFDIGLFAVSGLLPRVFSWLQPQSEEWQVQWEQLRADVGEWRTAHEAELRAAEGDAPIEPANIPAPSTDVDVP